MIFGESHALCFVSHLRCRPDYAGPRFAWDVEARVRHAPLGDIKVERHEVILKSVCLSLNDGLSAARGSLIGVVEFDRRLGF